MKQNTGLAISAITMLALIGAALFFSRSDSVSSKIRHADDRVPDSSMKPIEPSIEATPPAPAPKSPLATGSNSSEKPSATPAQNPPPAGVLPENVQSYLRGRTPSEVRPDGTQVFKDVPFYVKQKDGSMAIQPSTITITPTTVRPVVDDDAPIKKS